jgi:hypothetical protein
MRDLVLRTQSEVMPEPVTCSAGDPSAETARRIIELIGLGRDREAAELAAATQEPDGAPPRTTP